MTDEENEAWKHKADRKDLIALNEIKSNKHDVEQLMRCIDIQHKQISHLVVLFYEVQKTLISQKKESDVSIQNKRMYIFQQS